MDNTENTKPVKNIKLRGSMLKRAKHYLHELTRDPYTDWVVIVVVSILVSVTLVFFGYRNYVLVNESETAKDSPTAKNAIVFDVDAMNKALKSLDAVKQEREQLMREYAGPGDPSL